LAGVDELIRWERPLAYDLAIEKHDSNLLAQVSLRVELRCECARCLKPFLFPLHLEQWACLIPLEGPEKAEIDNFSVDLTPFLREDILLAYPQRPLCDPGCAGLPKASATGTQQPSGSKERGAVSSAWAELNKLKL